MWKDLRGALARLLRRSQAGADQRRAAATRARFWAELREGEREAAAEARERRRAVAPR
jgi:hypothetical protein